MSLEALAAKYIGSAEKVLQRTQTNTNPNQLN